ncbi:hypothetical protein HD806DRAFT_24127 [Xylariaceae sp. AK1471]|nr:hypothetical protein HD806DRAFT_24127 [Xylariaceae sp. AK1471]
MKYHLLQYCFYDYSKCGGCGRSASLRCMGCLNTPMHDGNSMAITAYCSRDCQVSQWPAHKAPCNIMQKRKKLLRVSQLLKATVLTYRDCAFDLDITKIKLRGGTLYMSQNRLPNPRRPYHSPFPSGLTDKVEFKEAALANNQCSLAMALLGPLTRHLLADVASSIRVVDIEVTPLIPTILVPASSLFGGTPPHTVLVVNLKNGESWVIDTTGCQYGFRDVLVPYDRYLREKVQKITSTPQKYDATETKDLDYYDTLSFMNTSKVTRRLERAARLHFATFVDEIFGQGKEGVGAGLLGGTDDVFQQNFNNFIDALRKHMMEHVSRPLK